MHLHHRMTPDLPGMLQLEKRNHRGHGPHTHATIGGIPVDEETEGHEHPHGHGHAHEDEEHEHHHGHEGHGHHDGHAERGHHHHDGEHDHHHGHEGHGHHHHDEEHDHHHGHEGHRHHHHDGEHEHHHGLEDHSHPHRPEAPPTEEKERLQRIVLEEKILDENDRIAGEVSAELHRQGVFAVNIMGAPGAGKTSSLIGIMKHLSTLTPCVIEGDIESDLDTKTLQGLGVNTLQINTGGACHLDGPLIRKAVERLSLQDAGILFIENIGNLVCPAEFSIGEDVKMLICTVTEGSDKPYKYPLAFEKADIILLNKVDLIPYLDFDEAFFMAGVRAQNRLVPVIKVSKTTGEGYPEVAKWLEERAKSITG